MNFDDRLASRDAAGARPAWVATMAHEYMLGAHPTPGGTLFRVWTTQARQVHVVLFDADGRMAERHPLEEREPNLFEALVPGVGPGALYKFQLGEDLFPDPYARYLPQGVHGPAMVWTPAYAWQHEAPTVSPEQAVLYELHVGTFTVEGTFEAAIARLPHLRALGVNTIELMPLAAFPGDRGWGYDGVALYAPFAGYGTPEDLCRFVDAAHGHGLAVILDVVYNHFGPDGNYLYAYSRDYFTDRHKTPWGDAPDFQNPFMRRLVLDNVEHWLTTYRFDGLRLDATHTIVDDGPVHLLTEIAGRVRELPGTKLLFAEDDRNDPALVQEHGLDGVWADDFHHHLHVLLTGERDGYYGAYAPQVADLARTITRGWFYDGQPWALSGKPRGKPADTLAARSFVYCLQNHDQVGNRALGDRLSTTVSPEAYRMASALLLFLPMTPLLFMGQEWAAETPFAFFSHHHGELGEAVSRGRVEEFSHFEAFRDPARRAAIPDPQADGTFLASKLDWTELERPSHQAMLDFYRELLTLRTQDPVLSAPSRTGLEAGAHGEVLWVRRRQGGEERLLLLNFGEAIALSEIPLAELTDQRVLLDATGGEAGMLPQHGALILAGRRAGVTHPLATYRLQLHAEFDFDRAQRALDYVQALGVSDVYTSPYLQAEAGSTHGYNVVSHAAVNEELGGEAGYLAFTDTLKLRGLGHVLDMVPNHMGITGIANAWWLDVLENGPSSLYADFFDIEWHPQQPGLQNKVLLPILGDQYGNVLERGELQLTRDGGQFWLAYWERKLPIAPDSLLPLLERAAKTVDLPESDPLLMELHSILNALRYLPRSDQATDEARLERAREKEVVKRRLEALCRECNAVCEAIDATVTAYNGRVGEPASFDDLDALLLEQSYRLSFWRVATEEINYRRFFDINELAAVRMEDPRVFEASHQLVLRGIAEGRITGLRLDHTDGLYDPLGYFRELQRRRLRQLTHDPARLERFEMQLRHEWGAELPRPLYVLAEKILEPGEKLPQRWPIHGTTGYDFLAAVNGLWVDRASEKAVTHTYNRFTGYNGTYPELLYRNKRLIMRSSLSSEVNVLAHLLEQLAEGNRRSRDFTLQSLTTAIVETIAAFPVYRSYLREDGSREELDNRHIDAAIRLAKRRNPALNASVFDYLRDVLMLNFPDNATPAQREEQAKFVLKFQQVTSPVMAKGAEDTTFYNYNRLTSLNEVGSDPAHFGTPVAEFHAGNAERQRDWPFSMLTTSTHDTKRGEDTRARISVLSEMQDVWRTYLSAWARWSKGKKVEVDGEPAPHRDDEYLFYLTVLGAWPLDGNFEGFTARVREYMTKATKEAKRHTSWINPNPGYDEAVSRFVEGMLSDRRFMRSMGELCARIAPYGATNGLAQTLLKLTAPGVPDLYQGSELWNQSLVDPDNRRPVDYALRQQLLESMRTYQGDPRDLAQELLERYEDGAVKLYVTYLALQARRRHPEVFQSGTYRALDGGPHVVAFAREVQGKAIVTAVPRLTYTLTGGTSPWAVGPVWEDRRLSLPRPGRYRNLLTGELLEDDTSLALGEVFAHFPVALLERVS